MGGVVDGSACAIERLVEECIDWMAARACELCIEFQTCLELTGVVDMEFAGVVVLVHLGGMKGGEHVVLVGGYVLVEGGENVIPPIDAEVVLGKLAWQVGFLVECIGELSLPIDMVSFGAVSHIAIGEEVGGEVCSGECGGAETQPVVVVGGDDGVDWTYIDVVRMEGVARLNKIFDECLETEKKEGEALDVGETVEE